MLKSKIIDELNESCDYRNCTQDGYYFHKWTENDIDFENNNKRRYCVQIRDLDPDDLYLCTSCRSIINKYEYEYENMNPHEMKEQTLINLIDKIYFRLDKIENDISSIKSSLANNN